MCVSDDLSDSQCCLEQLVSMLEIVMCVSDDLSDSRCC